MKRSIWNSSGGRVMLELLYGTEGIRRSGLVVEADRVSLCRRLGIRRGRLLDTLWWLRSQGLIEHLSLVDKTIQAKLKDINRDPEGQKELPCQAQL